MQAAMQPQLQLQQPLHIDPDPDNAAWTTSDEFRMYHFKISLRSKRFNHDWNFCPYAHTGERACRRDPLRYNYTSVTCLDMLQKGKCPRGDACQAAHSVFEFWLHPHRYRTEMCKVGAGCNRRICFFAHRPEELRPLPEHLANVDGSAGGKYSLSAALPGGSRKNNQQLSDQPGDLSQQQQKQRQLAAAQAGFVHGIGSSSSSSTSIVNLSNSLMACSTGGSNNNSPSAAASWLLPAGRDDTQAVIGVNGFDGMTLSAVSTALSSSSPQHMYSGGVSGQLPPRMPQVGAAQWQPQQQQQQQQQLMVAAGGVSLPAQQQQQLLMQQQQQSPHQALMVSNGLSLQLQQLSLGADVNSAAAANAVHVTAGLAAGVHGQMVANNWQQQQHMGHMGMPVVQQQQQVMGVSPQLLSGSAGMMAVNGHAMLGPVDFHQQQQQLYSQLQAGQACLPGMLAVTAAPQALCGAIGLQQQVGFIPGQVLQ